MSTPADLYDILGVSRDATPEEVRRAYRKKALQTHPDRLPQNVSPADKAAAEEQFRRVNNAYEVLNNPENRKLYDKYNVWPPPADQPDARRNAAGDTPRAPSRAARDPFANDPFFNTHFGPSSGPRSPQFVFTDPFVLFNSMFGDFQTAFQNDPFFANAPFTRSPFHDPFIRTAFGQMARDPFAGTPFSGALSRSSPFPGSMFGGSPFGSLLSGPAFDTSSTRVYSSTTQSLGGNGRFISQSQTTRTINGRTESISKRVDADGNEYVTYSSPDGERRTINGVEQPHRSINAPYRSNSTRAIADRPTEPPVAPSAQPFSVPISGSRHTSHTRAHSSPQPAPEGTHERRSSRHSHRERERTMTEDPRRRGHHVASIVTPTAGVSSREGRHSNQMDVDPPPGSTMPGGYQGADNRVREKHTSRQSSRHSHTYGDAPGPDNDRESDKGRDAGSPTSTGSRRGWRGWFSNVLHPFRRNHKEM